MSDLTLVHIRGGIAGDYLVLLDKAAAAEARRDFPDLPIYGPEQLALTEQLKGCPEGARAVALVKHAFPDALVVKPKVGLSIDAREYFEGQRTEARAAA